MSQQSSQPSRPSQGTSRRRRPGWWPALWAAAIAVTVVLSSGAVILTARMLQGGSEAAPAPAGDPFAAPVASTSPSTSAPSTTGSTPGITSSGAAEPGTADPGATDSVDGAATSRLVVLGPRRVVDTRPSRPLPAGAQVEVPLPDLPRGSTAVLVEVSILEAAGQGGVTLVSGSELTPVLRAAGKGAQTSATVVARLAPGDGLTARTEGGGDLVVTLTGAFQPATTTRAGRFVTVPPERALRLVPARDGKRATIRPDRLSLGGIPRAEVGAVLLAFQADVGVRGGTVAVGRSRNRLDQRIFWGATAPPDRTRRGFLVVPLSSATLSLEYQAGTSLTVDVVGLVTGAGAAVGSAGLSVPVAGKALPPVTLPAGGRADVDLPGAQDASAALVTAATVPDGGRPRSVLGLLEVRDGTVRVNGPERAEVTLTPRLLIR